MKKNLTAKITAMVLVLAMSAAFTAAAPASAAPEKLPGEVAGREIGDMTVYVMSDAKGEPEELYLTDKLAEALPEGSSKHSLPMFDSDGIKVEKEGIDSDLPLNMEVSYTLNGKKISPKKLAGKSGHVVIRYDYENLCKNTVKISDQDTEIYVPFAVVTSLILDNEKFSNVQVSSGKVVSDGSRSIVAGLAIPGLQENLDISKDIIDLPEYVEISADVEDFDVAMSLSLVTNDVFSGSEDMSYDTADIEAMFGQLRSAMDMLIDGATQLYDGIDLLYGKSGELIDGVTQLNDGMQQLNSHSGELADGAGQVFNSLLAMTNQQIAEKGLQVEQLTIGNYNDVLGALIDSLSPESMVETIKEQIIAKLEPTRPEFRQTAYVVVSTRLAEVARQEQRAAIAQQVEAEAGPEIREQSAKAVRAEIGIEVTNNIKDEFTEAVLAERGYGSFDELAPLEKAAVVKAVAVKMAMPDTINRIAEETESALAGEDGQARIEGKVQDALKVKTGLEITRQHENIEKAVAAAVEEQVALPENQDMIERHADDLMNEAVSKALSLELVNNVIVKQAEEGVKQLTSALASLNEYAGFYYGVRAYTDGVATAAEGVATLYSNMPALSSGVNQLRDGGAMLKDGIIRFDDEGISRITDALDGEIGELRDRMKASYDAARDYRGISSFAEDMPCVSYVYRTDSISKDK